MSIPKPPLNTVTSVQVDYRTLYHLAGGIDNEPYVQYEFGCQRKLFWSNFQTNSIYDKPVSVSGGVTTHLPDPDLESTYA